MVVIEVELELRPELQLQEIVAVGVDSLQRATVYRMRVFVAVVDGAGVEMVVAGAPYLVMTEDPE